MRTIHFKVRAGLPALCGVEWVIGVGGAHGWMDCDLEHYVTAQGDNWDRHQNPIRVCEKCINHPRYDLLILAVTDLE